MEGSTVLSYKSMQEWEEANPLRKWRLEKGFSQRQVARDLGVSITSYRDWEFGLTIPNARNMAKIQKLLKTPTLLQTWEDWWNAKPEEV